MKRIVLSLLPVIGLVGCGTLPTPSAQMQAPAAAGAVAYQVDLAKMNLIDQLARKRGVQVVWVNAPRRAVVTGS